MDGRNITRLFERAHEARLILGKENPNNKLGDITWMG